ncbi:hypothetical protein FRD01_23435 [Microvenator marinus]|uniref:Peptidase C-terminal archaeal/bacterial domain-containing protein n=1 Tax=Microvenator marinus TaxID=2600177 RepID=A0A5B8XW47_9DELT|nr:hypothetical protein FRD01_23435 [Microvenator marinus]
MSSENEPLNILSVEFYPEVGGDAPSPLVGPGTYMIGSTPADQNYETCQTCVTIFEQCSQETGCAKVYFAEAGQIEFTGYDEENRAVIGEVSGLQLREVTIDENTFRSTPVANGGTWCVDSLAFDTTPECTTNDECTDEAKPFCSDSLTCVECLGILDCGSDLPLCVEGACTAIETCTGDVDEPNNHPTTATAYTLGTDVTGGMCSGTTTGDVDWYSFTLATDQTVSATLAWEGNHDIDFYVFGADAVPITGSQEANPPSGESFVELLPAGDYYFIVTPFETLDDDGAAAITYTLRADATDPCTDNASCTGDAGICDVATGLCVGCLQDSDCDATNPVCIGSGAAAACGIVDSCVDDDANEHGDDGALGANTLTVATEVSAKICTDEDALEADWYTFTLDADATVTVTATWTDPDTDIDFRVYEADIEAGSVASGSSTDNPEVAAGVALTAGVHFIKVRAYESPGTVDYTINVTID